MTAHTMVFGVVDPDVEHVFPVLSVDTPHPLLASFEGAEQLQRIGALAERLQRRQESCSGGSMKA